MTDKILEKNNLAKIRKTLGSLSTQEKKNLIAHAAASEKVKIFTSLPDGAKLCEELAKDEFFYTLKEVDEEQRIELLSCASSEQVQFALDFELWKKDIINPEKIYEWLPLLRESVLSEDTSFLRDISQELLLCIFQYLFRVFTIPDEMDIMEAREKLPPFTIDSVYYLEFLCPEKVQKDVIDLLKRLFNYDKSLYQFIMEALPFQLESNLVESSWQERVERLSYDGIPTFDEAMAIYRPITENELGARWNEESSSVKKITSYPMKLEKSDNLFREAFSSLDMNLQNRLQLELSVISNKIIVADLLDPCEIESLSLSLGKTTGFINIALQVLSNNDRTKAASILRSNIPLQYFFRLGYREVTRLKEKAAALFQGHSPDERQFYISLLGYPLKESVEGLQRVHPLFFSIEDKRDGKKEYDELREFVDVYEVIKCSERLKHVEGILCIFQKAFPLNKKQIEHIHKSCIIPKELEDLNYHTLLMTLLGNVILYGKEEFVPIPESKVLVVTEKAFKESEKIANDFVSFLTSRFNVPKELIKYIKKFIDSSLRDIAEQHVSRENFQSRYFSGVCVKQD